ncbi:MAG: L,D-transpeptidase family protein [Pseudomonadota bacterium]
MRLKQTSRPAHALAAFLMVASVCASAADLSPEQQLLSAVAKMKSGDADGARTALQDLTQRLPNFRLAKQIYGELLSSMPGGTLIDTQGDPRLSDLTEEARLRALGDKAVPPPGYVPNSVLQLDSEHPFFIVVDLPKARLYLMQNNKDREMTLVRNHYASIGRNGYGKQSSGDLRTPIGIYHITGWLPKMHLPDLYGEGAFPLNYPNLWDQFNSRSGYGIWLHGVPKDTYVRAPRSSEGCVTMSNDDLLALKPYIVAGDTPVILSDSLEWVPPDQIKDEREQFLARLEDWRDKWAQRNTEAYLAYYGQGFTTEGMNFAQFAAHKVRVNSSKKFIDVKLRHINLFRYPGAGEPMMLAEFTLDYRSDNFSSTSVKQQYWRQDKDGNWKIFREENR